MITEVKIFNVDDFTTLFETANPIKVTIRDEHKATQFAVESGESRSDHVVVQPIEINMDLILTGETKNAFERMQQIYDTHQLVGIQTRVKTYQPMLLVSFSHDETPDMADAINLSLHFTEWQAVEPEYGELPPRKVAKKEQSSTVNRGKVQTVAVPETEKKKGSAATQGWDYIKEKM
ncbi:hypothetical protein M5X66_10465 [Providencia sp. PROV188]|uniref:Dit-like phage tail protein N-terminal domain-containing protein n=1 Tax=Providencia alcalifaciens TaxID=126385 RepID=A0A4R3NPK9_9GAMM|nr:MULTISPECIES: hypothetical protein [Providencia]ETT00038.1 hypothetical protein HMPREF1568_0237 [Providencia alcalifaciens PAL-3]EUD00834.1 hypothetical protein HMPREF1566_2826 [Providencia alcalifaciens PAL-1]MTC40811.1 hypothetical protein [Providencia sp. wls1921]TCT36718.1 hypothetical protein EC835_102169 [Providencia alcalifaciens]WBM59431.1 hypothetical protein M5X66_10465 [Providencia sp. PROV188]